MRSIWMGISPGPSATRVIAMAGPGETILKARLSPQPAHPRALSTLLEAVALWQGTQVHAALCAGERDGVGDFGGEPVSGGGPNMDKVRKAKRIKMWLLTSSVHPLVEHEGRSPLEWLRAGLVGSGLDLGILRFETDGDQLRLRPDLRWPLTI